MYFNDEYELELDGETFCVEVEGDTYLEEGVQFYELDSVSISDEIGNSLDEEHPKYDAVKQDALDRAYEVEIHSRDFDHSDYDVDSFLME